MAEKTPKSNLTENFTLIRFAEYRPSTFTSDFTLEIPTLAQHITDESFQPINIVVWLELTSLTVKNAHLICTRLEELLATTLEVGKEIFHTFPPVAQSFTLTVNLLKYNISTQMIETIKLTKSFDQINSMLFKGLGRDIEKWIMQHANDSIKNPNFDLTRWNLQQGLVFIYDKISQKDESSIKDIHLLFLSCWHTEGPFEELYQLLEPFTHKFVSWIYLFTLSPINSLTVGLADLMEISIFDLLIDEKKIENLQLQWKNTLLTLIEPILEVTVLPTDLGLDYETATNLPFFQKQKTKENGFIIYNLQSQRYPLRMNFLVTLPVSTKDTPREYNPVVWKEIVLQLRMSNGKEFKKDLITEGTSYRLSASETLYQPERELNARMRRAQRLKNKLQAIIDYQSETSAQIKKLISEPEYLEKMINEEMVQESISDLKLAFEIIDYLQEQELLLAELPPVSKKFEPPQNNNSLI